MIALLSLLPCAAVVVAVLVFRWSGLWAALLALALALGIWATGPFGPAAFDAFPRAAVDALLLAGMVGSVIVPGLAYVEVCRRVGSLDAIGRAIDAMRLDLPRAAVVVVTGVGIMLESLTGFGVSLLVSVPLLLALVSRERVFPLGLIGMSLMPWGALSVAALLGAELAGLPVERLATAVLTTSGPVAFFLPLTCLLFVPGVGFGTVGFALAAGMALFAGIATTSYAVGVEIAGVGGGLAVILLALASAPDRWRVARTLSAPPLALLWLLILGVVAQKLVVAWLAREGIAPVAASERVSILVLSSPGIALILATLVGLACWPKALRVETGPLLWRLVPQRTWQALTTILVFLTTARLLVEIGGIGALSNLLAEIGVYPAVAVVSGLGAVGAYVTGSAVPSAALFMPSAAAVGESFGDVPLFAALQHSAAGHAAMASLPVVAIMLAALPERQPGDEARGLAVGCKLAAVWLALVLASGWTQLMLR